MPLEKEPFTSTLLEEERGDRTFNIRITKRDMEWFAPAKKFINQPKNSTAMKQLAEIGAANVLHDKKTHTILDIIQNNSRRAKRLGIAESEYRV